MPHSPEFKKFVYTGLFTLEAFLLAGCDYIRPDTAMIHQRIKPVPQASTEQDLYIHRNESVSPYTVLLNGGGHELIAILKAEGLSEEVIQHSTSSISNILPGRQIEADGPVDLEAGFLRDSKGLVLENGYPVVALIDWAEQDPRAMILVYRIYNEEEAAVMGAKGGYGSSGSGQDASAQLTPAEFYRRTQPQVGLKIKK